MVQLRARPRHRSLRRFDGLFFRFGLNRPTRFDHLNILLDVLKPALKETTP